MAAPYPGNYNLNKLEFLLPNDAFTNVSFQLSCPNGFEENFLLFVPIIKSNPLIYALFFPRGSWFEQKMVCSLPVDVSTQGTTFLVKWFWRKIFFGKVKNINISQLVPLEGDCYPFFLTNLNSLYPRMPCARFG